MLQEKTVAKVVGHLPKKVLLKVYSDKGMLEFVKKLATLSDSIEYEFLSEKESTTNLPGIEIANVGIFFHLIPQHSELESFLLAIKLASEAESTTRGSMEIVTFVSSFCQNCRIAVDAVNKVAIKLGLKHHIIDVSQFPDIAEKYGIYGVPTVFAGKIVLRRVFTDQDFETWIRGAMEGDYYEFIAYKLEIGEIEDLGELIDKTETLAELMAHENFFVRLGAMALLERLAKNGAKISREAREEIKRLLKHEDSRIREDAVMMLGIVGDKEDLCVLESLTSDESVGESAKEAIQMIRERYGS
ncbi:MAG: thioredoxin family protein [Archaeoglobaceae archaeon]